jgi:hypothetical protein
VRPSPPLAGERATIHASAGGQYAAAERGDAGVGGDHALARATRLDLPLASTRGRITLTGQRSGEAGPHRISSAERGWQCSPIGKPST